MIQEKPKNLTGRKAQQLYGELATELQSGKFRIGDQFHTIGKVCDDHAVSTATAVKCMSLLAEQGYLEQRQGSGTYVRKVPGSTAAAHLHGAHVLPCLDYVMPEGIADRAGREYLSELVTRVPRHRNTDHLALRVNLMPDRLRSAEEIEEWLQRLLDSGAQALVFRWMPRAAQEVAVKNHWPACVHGHPDPGIDLPFVDLDQKDIGWRVGRHLIELGCRRVGVILRAEWRLGDNLAINSMLEQLGERFAAIETAPPTDDDVDAAVRRLLSREPRIDALVVRNHPGRWLPQHAHELRAGNSPMPILCEWKWHPAVTQIVPSEKTMTEAMAEVLENILQGKQIESSRVELPVKILLPL